MHNISNVKATLFILSLLAFPLLGITFQTQVQKIDVKIFQVPAFQTIIKTEPSLLTEEGVVGGITGTKTGGYVTGFFPDGIVLFETDLKLNHEGIIKSIRERTMSSRPDWVNILPVADVQVIFSMDNLEGGVAEGRNYTQGNKSLDVDYDFKATPLMVIDEETVLKVVFCLKETTGEDKVLLVQTISLKAEKTLAVGFPTNDESGRGTVFWLACSIIE